MLFEPGSVNSITGAKSAIDTVNNIHVFFGFNSANLKEVRTVDPCINPAFHVFIHDNRSADDNEAIVELMLTCEDLRQRWRQPMSITLYVPERHTVLKQWAEAYYSAYTNEVIRCQAGRKLGSCINSPSSTPVHASLFNQLYVGNQFVMDLFNSRLKAPYERLIMNYDLIHLGQQVLRVGYERSPVAPIQPPWEYAELGRFPIYPSDDWLTSGHPGHQ